MQRKKVSHIIFVLILLSLLFTSGQGVVSAGIEEPPLEANVGELTQPRKYVIVDTDEAMQGIQFPAESELLSRTPGATFTITYVPNGGNDKWSEPCYTFPEAAKGAFNYAAAIWAAKISSPVPITIRACWADLGDPSILGYSGGGTLSYNFSGAPLTNTAYSASLANALHGSDLNPANDDMHITYNQNFSWYYGTDGNPGAGKYDLVTVAAHEIAHGLNFSGSATVSGGVGSYGYNVGIIIPNIYDTFMRNNAGTLLTSYTNPSTALGTLLTSGSLWFHGSNAMVANGSSRVKMYAPATWAPGSSYSHLDYATFAGTINSMMVYAVASNASQHNTGPVTDGLLKDLGWTSATTTYYSFLPIMVNDTGIVVPPDPILNGDFESGQVNWVEFSTHGWDIVMDLTGLPPHSGSWGAWLGGEDSDTSSISQTVTVPVGRSVLHYWYLKYSDEVGCTFDYFNFYVGGVRQIHQGQCSSTNTSGWVEGTFDLTAWAGTSVALKFEVVTDSSVNTNVFLDDVSLETTARTSGSILFEGVNTSSITRH